MTASVAPVDSMTLSSAASMMTSRPSSPWTAVVTALTAVSSRFWRTSWRWVASIARNMTKANADDADDGHGGEREMAARVAAAASTNARRNASSDRMNATGRTTPEPAEAR